MVEVKGKKYKDTLEYALDTTRNDTPIDPKTGKGTIDCSPSWSDWVAMVKKNEQAFKEMTVDEIDNAFFWFDGGYQWGMVKGINMARR